MGQIILLGLANAGSLVAAVVAVVGVGLIIKGLTSR